MSVRPYEGAGFSGWRARRVIAGTLVCKYFAKADYEAAQAWDAEAVKKQAAAKLAKLRLKGKRRARHSLEDLAAKPGASTAVRGITHVPVEIARGGTKYVYEYFQIYMGRGSRLQRVKIPGTDEGRLKAWRAALLILASRYPGMNGPALLARFPTPDPV